MRGTTDGTPASAAWIGTRTRTNVRTIARRGMRVGCRASIGGGWTLRALNTLPIAFGARRRRRRERCALDDRVEFGSCVPGLRGLGVAVVFVFGDLFRNRGPS